MIDLEFTGQVGVGFIPMSNTLTKVLEKHTPVFGDKLLDKGATCWLSIIDRLGVF